MLASNKFPAIDNVVQDLLPSAVSILGALSSSSISTVNQQQATFRLTLSIQHAIGSLPGSPHCGDMKNVRQNIKCLNAHLH
ncbi:hypothetical protein GA0061084_0724 [Arthrobacter sp. NIO-1057]|nr:hypothetical protein GA0061084_0724 [Arthrobacter sp. NIO-1057]